jgi:hypothetical protein
MNKTEPFRAQKRNSFGGCDAAGAVADPVPPAFAGEDVPEGVPERDSTIERYEFKIIVLYLPDDEVVVTDDVSFSLSSPLTSYLTFSIRVPSVVAVLDPAEPMG